MNIVIDKEFSRCLRKLTEDEDKGLEKLLQEHGCLSPLIVWDEKNILLDGQNRLRLCEKLNIPYQIKRVSFADRKEAFLWVLRHQRDKRNCTDGEKYAITRQIRNLLADQGKKRQAHGLTAPGRTLLSPSDKSETINTQKNIAGELGWSTGKVAQADYVWQHGKQKMKDKLISGDVTVKQAYRETKKQQQKQQRVSEQSNNVIDLSKTSESFRLLTCSIADVGSQIEDASLDWIITDGSFLTKNYWLNND